MRVLLALLALSQGAGLMALQYSAVTARNAPDNEKLKAASKSLDFVNKVREDLRRNNDDYALLEPTSNQLEQAAAPAAPARRAPVRMRGPRAHYSRRGQGDDDLAQPYLGDGKQSNQSAAGFRSLKPLRNMRFSKLKKRLNRKKYMLRQLDPTLENTEETAEPTDTLTSEPPPATSTARTARDVPPAATYLQAMKALTATHAPRRPMRNRPPLPDQLDMAHARNPVITRIRLKGRLCQRSLMNMEGPTYDRDGKEVLPAHRPHHANGRLFNQTIAPDLVLPKCCNCCKKSVLGCQ